MFVLFLFITLVLLLIVVTGTLHHLLSRLKNAWYDKQRIKENEKWAQIGNAVQEHIVRFVETGEKFNEEFDDLLSNYSKKERDRLILSIARSRKLRIELRDKALSEFKSWQECPACTKEGNFIFEDVVFNADEHGMSRSIVRICTFCDHKWYQK